VIHSGGRPAPPRRGLWPNFFFLFVTAAGAAVALIVPEDAQPGTWLAPLRTLMTMLVPSIELFADGSNIPGVTRNFLPIAWACVPLMSYLNLRLRVVTYERGEVSTNVFAFAFGVAFFAWLALMPILWLDMTDPQGPQVGTMSVLSRLVANSAFWLGVVGSFLCWVASVAITMLYRLLSNNLHFAWTRLHSRRRSTRE
jgi:hypothetical protein